MLLAKLIFQQWEKPDWKTRNGALWPEWAVRSLDRGLLCGVRVALIFLREEVGRDNQGY